MVVATYFLTQEAKFLQGVWLGVKTAFAHVGGAIVLILTTDIALRSVILDPETHMYLLRNISFSLIILVGSVMLIQAILHATGKVKNTGCAHCNHAAHAHSHKHEHHHHDHSHDHSNSHDHSHKHKHNKKETFIALSIGAIPCTGSLLILLYAMANDILYFGLLMVVFVALGMALTMIVLGLVTILGKKKLIDKIFNTTRHAHKGKIVLELAGALFIIAIGSLLLWVNL
jgi:ABC-type nickel/cobalt efflux system permease component RcnA